MPDPTTPPVAPPADEETAVRIYLVEGDDTKRLVLATSSNQAVGFCLRKKFTATVPKPRRLKNLLDEKIVIEDATAKRKGSA